MSDASSAIISSRPRQIERQQPRQDLCIPQILWPAVGGEHGRVEATTGRSQPIRACVVKVGERALLQFLFGQVGRVEPGVARELTLTKIWRLLLRQAECMFVDWCTQKKPCLMAQAIEQGFDLRNVAALFGA